MAKNTGWKVFYAVLAVIVVASLLGFGLKQTNFGIIGGSSDNGGCEIVPTVTASIVNAENRGTIVSATASYIVNGRYFGTSAPTFAEGDDVEMLLSASNYIDVKIDNIPALKCGANTVAAEMYATDDQTVTIKTDAGTATLSDAAVGGTVNETAFSAGGSKTWEINIQGTDKQSSGKMIMVVELGSDENVSSVTLAGDLAVTKLGGVPSGLTTSGSNAHRVAFEISEPVIGAVKKTLNLNVAAASSKTISGAVYITFYSAQAYVSPSGAIEEGVVDSDGTVQYEDDFDYDFFVTA